MVTIENVWNFVSSTGVNSVLTFFSIVLALWALWTAKKTKDALEEYSRNLKKSEFLNYVHEFHLSYKDYQRKVASIGGKFQEWNKAGKGSKIIKQIVEAKSEINEYYDTISLPENIKQEYEKLHAIASRLTAEQPSAEILNAIDIQLGIIDKALKKVAQSIKVNILS